MDSEELLQENLPNLNGEKTVIIVVVVSINICARLCKLNCLTLILFANETCKILNYKDVATVVETYSLLAMYCFFTGPSVHYQGGLDKE